MNPEYKALLFGSLATLNLCLFVYDWFVAYSYVALIELFLAWLCWGQAFLFLKDVEEEIDELIQPHRELRWNIKDYLHNKST